MQAPEITVFMAVYNGEKYIKEAIDSIINQTFSNFELLIVNDGSLDQSLAVINSFDDERIRLISHEKNQGLFKTRNTGLRNARGKYFATLDADDIAHHKRLEIEYLFLEANGSYSVCGGKGIAIDGSGNFIGQMSVPVGDHDFLKGMMLFSNPFINSSTMIRMSLLKTMFYRDDFEPAEDFDLFERLVAISKVKNLDQTLVYYRVHSSNTTSNKKAEQLIAEKKIIQRQLIHNLQLVPSQSEIDLHHTFISNQFKKSPFVLLQYLRWLDILIAQNKKTKAYHESAFSEAIFCQLMKMILLNRSIITGFKIAVSKIFRKEFSTNLFFRTIMSIVKNNLKRGSLQILKKRLV